MNNPYDPGCAGCGQQAAAQPVQQPVQTDNWPTGGSGQTPQNAQNFQAPQYTQNAPQNTQAPAAAPYFYTGSYTTPSGVSPSLQVPATLTQPPAGSTQPITPLTQPAPVTTESIQYLNGYLRTQIGRRVTVEFLIGTNTLVDRTGTLLGVGANYLLINEIETDDITVCDFFTLKFVRIYG